MFIFSIDSNPKTLFTDFGREICSDDFEHFLLAHKNIPSRYWDIVAEHFVALNAVTSLLFPQTLTTQFRRTMTMRARFYLQSSTVPVFNPLQTVPLPLGMGVTSNRDKEAYKDE